MLILDTNMLLRYLLHDNEDMHKQAKEIIRTQDVLMPVEVIAEIVYVLSKVYSIERNTVQSLLLQLIATRNIHTPNDNLIECAVNYYAGQHLDFVDCLLIAYHEVDGYDVLTFDKKLLRHL